jgi:hypothetical protein
MSDTFNHELDAFESWLDDGGDVEMIAPDEQPRLMSENDNDMFDALRGMF